MEQNIKKITSKIVAYKVLTQTDAQDQIQEEQAYDTMHENISRDEVLRGFTYKIKTPSCEHAMYITINDIVLNQGTPKEERRPYEIFINSKNMEHFQWVIALTRVISAVFRKGGDITFLVEELLAVFDPKGGFYKKKKFVPSLVAEIGNVIELHLKSTGHIIEHVDSDMAEFLEKKREEAKEKGISNASLCTKCNTMSSVRMDNCMTCLNCGDSKCG